MNIRTIQSLPVPGVQYPHKLASGAGTESNPYTHADGTGGIQTAINTLASLRGGRVPLVSSRFNLTSTVLISTHSIHLDGLSLGENIDPNGESEGINGTKLHSIGTAIRVAVGSVGRPAGVTIKNLYVWGPGKSLSNGFAAVEANGCDQLLVERINAANISIGYSVPGGADSARFVRASALNCGYGFKLAGGLDYGSISDCPIFDCDFQGVYNAVTTPGFGMHHSRIGRTARVGGLTDPCNVYWASSNGQIVGCTFWWAGYNSPTATHVNTTAPELILAGSYNCITGNYFQSRGGNNPAIVIRGNSNVIVGNTYFNYVSGPGYIVLALGASNNIIMDRNVGIINNSGNNTNVVPDSFGNINANSVAAALYTGGTWKSDRGGSSAGFGGGDAGFYIGGGGSFNIIAPGGVTVNGVGVTVP